MMFFVEVVKVGVIFWGGQFLKIFSPALGLAGWIIDIIWEFYFVNVNVNVRVLSPHPGKPALLTVQFTPGSLGLSYDTKLSIAYTFKQAYHSSTYWQLPERTYC